MNVNGKVFRSGFYVWPGLSAFITAGMATPLHYHSTIQVVIDPETNFKIEDGSGTSTTCNCAIILHDTPHKLDSNGSHQIILYIEKDSSTGRKVIEKYLRDRSICFPEFSLNQDHIRKVLTSAIAQQQSLPLFHALQNILKSLLGESQQTEPRDARILKIRHMVDTSAHPAMLKTEQLAGEVHLSASRMRHLFKEQTGMSIHKYILWRRIIYSIHLILTGHSISDAAFECGFSDLSHYNKTMMKMQGISPSRIIRENENFTVKPSGKNIFEMQTGILNSGKLIGHKF